MFRGGRARDCGRIQRYILHETLRTSPTHDRVRTAIHWLDKQGFVHRDISDGNILLAREEPSTFNTPQTRQIRLLPYEEHQVNTLKLVQRKSRQRDDVYGLLHDLDMVGVTGIDVSVPGLSVMTTYRHDDRNCSGINHFIW